MAYKRLQINYNSYVRFLNLGNSQKVDPEVQEEGGGDLTEQAWERKQAGLDEGGVLVGQIQFDEPTLEKIRAKNSKGKEL
ncbi:MAG: hypothetical protein QY322_03690 [bacterium]|nr:MAG: hypothetical protein QY322_03690 [bacterium]